MKLRVESEAARMRCQNAVLSYKPKAKRTKTSRKRKKAKRERTS